MEEDLATQFKTEGDPAFPVEDTENDNSASSSEGEETTTEETPSSEENKEQTENKEEEGGAGLADHPRWKEREDDWKSRFNEQEKRHMEELDNIRKELDAKFSQKENKSSEVPSWFGGDEAQWAEYQTWTESKVSQAKEQAVNEVLSKTQQEQKAVEEATNYFNENVAKIEAGGEKVDRNKLLKFTMDNDLVDSQGRWNYQAAYKLMQAEKQQSKDSKLKDKKAIASATTSEKKAEDAPKNYVTSQDFTNPMNRPW